MRQPNPDTRLIGKRVRIIAKHDPYRGKIGVIRFVNRLSADPLIVEVEGVRRYYNGKAVEMIDQEGKA